MSGFIVKPKKQHERRTIKEMTVERSLYILESAAAGLTQAMTIIDWMLIIRFSWWHMHLTEGISSIFTNAGNKRALWQKNKDKSRAMGSHQVQDQLKQLRWLSAGNLSIVQDNKHQCRFHPNAESIGLTVITIVVGAMCSVYERFSSGLS